MVNYFLSVEEIKELIIFTIFNSFIIFGEQVDNSQIESKCSHKNTGTFLRRLALTTPDPLHSLFSSLMAFCVEPYFIEHGMTLCFHGVAVARHNGSAHQSLLDT